MISSHAPVTSSDRLCAIATVSGSIRSPSPVAPRPGKRPPTSCSPSSGRPGLMSSSITGSCSTPGRARAAVAFVAELVRETRGGARAALSKRNGTDPP